MGEREDGMDDAEWEEWLSLTDAQQEAILDREMSAYFKRLDAMTPLQLYRHRRGRMLETVLSWKRSVKTMDIPVIHQHLRKSQRLLLQARLEYFHGVKGQA